VKPELATEWRRLSRAEREARTMSLLLDGRFILGHLDGKLTEGENAEIASHTATAFLKEWQEKGFVKGFLPLLTPEGREYFVGLKNIANALPREAIDSQPGTGQCPYCGEPEPHRKEVKCFVTRVHETTSG
jgi:hypothetical protein